MSWGPALAMLGVMAFPFVVGWTLLSESITLYLMQPRRSFWRSVGDVTKVNLVSGTVGVIRTLFFFDITKYFFWVNSLIGSPPIDIYQTIDDRTVFLGTLLLFLGDWIGSIILEGFVLAFLRVSEWDFASANEPGGQRHYFYAFMYSTVINSISYVGLIAGLVLYVRPF